MNYLRTVTTTSCFPSPHSQHSWGSVRVDSITRLHLETSEPWVATWPTMAGHLEDQQNAQSAHVKTIRSRGSQPRAQTSVTRTKESVPKPNSSYSSSTYYWYSLRFSTSTRKNSLSTTEPASTKGCPGGLNGGLSLDTLDELV